MSRHLSGQHGRGHNAAEALLEVRERLRGQVGPANEHSAWLYSHHILAMDDKYGSSAGLVVQGDELLWSTIDALVDHALFGQSEHLRQCHPDMRGTQDCEACHRAQTFSQIWLAGPIEERRGNNLGELTKAANQTLGPKNTSR
jgi:hypothetical protein